MPGLANEVSNFSLNCQYPNLWRPKNMMMNRKQNSTLRSRNNALRILYILLCLPISSFSKAPQSVKHLDIDRPGAYINTLTSRDSIPEERKHLLEIVNDTTENGTFNKKKLIDAPHGVIFQQSELRKSDKDMKPLATKSPVIIRRGKTTYGLGRQPLIYIDDVKVKPGELQKLPRERIESYTIIKDLKDLEPYGEEGKNGVIIITTKPVE